MSGNNAHGVAPVEQVQEKLQQAFLYRQSQVPGGFLIPPSESTIPELRVYYLLPGEAMARLSGAMTINCEAQFQRPRWDCSEAATIRISVVYTCYTRGFGI